MNKVLIPNSSPLITFRLLVNTGAANDPPGQEGVANLTAALLAGGGSRTMTYEAIVQTMYPMATSFHAQVDKEMTVFSGTTHRDNLDQYYQLISTMLLAPGWREDDFTRVKEDAINFLKVTLRNNNDEELGKEALYNFIYEGTEYSHHNVGTVAALERLTLADLKAFYRDHYTQANFVLGLAGGFPESLPAKIKTDLAQLPAGGEEAAAKLKLRQPRPIKGRKLKIVERDTRATAISFGFPLPLNRSHKDWVALKVVESYFGQHRSSNSHLYKVMRQTRGLNYGDYAYIEYFPRGMFQFHPDPNLARQQQIFQVWLRPVEPQNGHFALRLAMYELQKLVDSGLSAEDFAETRQFLTKYVNLLTKDQDKQLGYALDSNYYGLPDFNDYLRRALAHLTLADVNRAIKQYLQYENIKFVVVTKDGAAFSQQLLANQPSPMNYLTPPAPEVLAEDKLIEQLPLNFKPENIKVVPVNEIFQRNGRGE